MQKFLKIFTVFDLMKITVLAALGIAVGSVIGPLVRIVTGPLFIPGGAVAGGIYMLFLVLSVSFTGKKSAAILCGITQAFIVMATGFGGHHGAMTIITYTMPGVMIFVLLFVIRHNGCCKLCLFFSGMIANLTGTFLVGVGIMALPFVPMMLSLCMAALSGGLGGLLGWRLTTEVKKFNIL